MANHYRTPMGVDTFGDVIVPHEETIRQQAEELDDMVQSVRRFLHGQSKGVGKGGPGYTSFTEKRIMVAHFSYYCSEGLSAKKYLLPAEFAIYPFTLNGGLELAEGLYGLVDNESIPTGLRSAAVEMSETLSVPLIGKFDGIEAKIWDAKEAYEMIELWCKEYGFYDRGQICIFVLREHIPIADRCLKWLKLLSGDGKDDRHKLRFLPLSILAMELRDSLGGKLRTDVKLPDEGAAERLLEHPQFAYAPELGCEWHKKAKNRDAVDKCSRNIVQRMIYNILGYMCYVKGIDPKVPTHSPFLEKVDVVDRALMKQLEEGTEPGFPRRKFSYRKNQDSY